MPTLNRITSGQRERLITIEAGVDAMGPSAFPIQIWSTLAPPMWAACDNVGGGETFGADQLSGTAEQTWTILYRADCDPELLDVIKVRRVVYQGRVYDIVAATHLGRHQGLQLHTRAKVG